MSQPSPDPQLPAQSPQPPTQPAPAQPAQSQPAPAQPTQAPPKRRSWIRRHPILSIIIAIPILLCLFPCALLSSAIVQGFARGIRISYASTPQDLAVAATENGQNVSVSGDTTSYIEIKETLGISDGNATYRQNVLEDCYDLQSTFWEHYPHLQELDVLIYGPATNGTTGLDDTAYFGGCTMKHVNAINQSWDQMDAASAWAIYDSKDLEPIIES